jgi:23S rRNA C2498 (ribose-2'-O)-methylase RlmM
MIWAGEGRWSFETIYNMPLPMRKFWIQKINDLISNKNNTSNDKSNTLPKSPIRKKSL